MAGCNPHKSVLLVQLIAGWYPYNRAFYLSACGFLLIAGTLITGLFHLSACGFLLILISLLVLGWYPDYLHADGRRTPYYYFGGIVLLYMYFFRCVVSKGDSLHAGGRRPTLLFYRYNSVIVSYCVLYCFRCVESRGDSLHAGGRRPTLPGSQ